MTQSVPKLDKAIMEQDAKEPPAPTDKPKARKRPYSIGMLTILLYLLFLIILLCVPIKSVRHIFIDLILIMSHLIGRPDQPPRGGIAAGIRRYF